MRRLLILAWLGCSAAGCGGTCGPASCYPEEIGCGPASYGYGHRYRYFGDGRLCGEAYPVSRRLKVHEDGGP
jgi:hypothetical protein